MSSSEQRRRIVICSDNISHPYTDVLVALTVQSLPGARGGEHIDLLLGRILYNVSDGEKRTTWFDKVASFVSCG